MLNKNSKIYLAGHKGLVGSAILRRLKKKDFEILFIDQKKKLILKNKKKF